MFFSGDTNLKYFKRENRYRNSTDSCSCDIELRHGSSYNETIYKVIKFGKKEVKIFNDYNFSPTTSSHQGGLWSFYRDINLDGISVNLSSINQVYTKTGLLEAIFKNIGSCNLKVVKDHYPKQLKKYEKLRETYLKKEKEQESLDRKVKKFQALDYSVKNIVKKSLEILDLRSKTYSWLPRIDSGRYHYRYEKKNIDFEKLLLLLESEVFEKYPKVFNDTYKYYGNDYDFIRKLQGYNANEKYQIEFKFEKEVLEEMKKFDTFNRIFEE